MSLRKQLVNSSQAIRYCFDQMCTSLFERCRG